MSVTQVNGDRRAWQRRLRVLAEDRDDAGLLAAIQDSPFAGTPWGELEHARGLIAGHDLVAALEALTRLVAGEPDFDAAAAWRVAVLDRLCRFDEAGEAAAEALTKFDGSVDVLVAAGRFHLGRGASDRALALLEDAQRVDARRGSVVRGLIFAFMDLGRWDEAEEVAREQVRLCPDRARAHSDLGYFLYWRDRDAEALEAFEQALAVEGTHADALEMRTACLRALRRWDDAEASAESATVLRPRVPDLWGELGLVYVNTSRLQEALAVYERALEIDPRHPQLRHFRVQALESMRRWADAEAAAAELVAEYPDVPGSYMTLGGVFRAQDRGTEALSQYERALSLDPRLSDALESCSSTLRILHRWSEAETSARAFIDAYPHHSQPRVALGRVFDDQDLTPEALAEYEHAFRIDARDGFALRLRAGALRDLKRWAEAETAARDLIALQPNDPQSYLALGWVWEDQDQDSEALAEFERALSVDPGHEYALGCRVRALRVLRRWNEAEEAAQALIAAHPYSPESYLNLAWVFGGQDREAEALVECDRALGIDARHKIAMWARLDTLLALQRWDDADTTARDLVAAHPHDPSAYVNLGRTFARQGRFAEALPEYERALQIDGRNADGLRLRVDVLLVLDRWDDAEAAARELVAGYPRDPHSWESLGVIFARRGRHDEALAAFEQALEHDATLASVLRNRVRSLRSLRRWDAAEAAARDLVAAHPLDPQSYLYLGWVFSDQDLDAEALAEYDRALELVPDDVDAMRNRVDALRFLARWEDAEAAARALIAAHPDDPQSYANLGWVFSDQGRDTDALAEYERGLAIDPRHSTVLRAKADVLDTLRRWDEAEAAARELVVAHPDDPRSFSTLGGVFADRGLYVEALAEYERALEVDHRDSSAMQDRADILRFLRRWDDAEAAARELVSAHPMDPQSHVSLGWVLSDRGLDAEALAEYERALGVDPTWEAAIRYQVRALRNLRRWDDAETAARQLVALHPRRPQSFVELGQCFADQELDVQALAEYERGLAVDSRHPTAMRSKVIALRALRRWTEAEAAAREVIAAYPLESFSYVGLGWVFGDQGLDAEALAEYDRALEADHRDNIALRFRVSALRALFRWGDAEAAARTLIAEHPTDPMSSMNLGWVYDDQNLDAEALAEYERALQVDPGHLVARRFRASALRVLRRWTEAEEASRGLIAAYPLDAQSYVNLAWVLGDLGRDEDAIVQFDEALRIHPGHAPALRWRAASLALLRRWDESEDTARLAVRLHPASSAAMVDLSDVLDARGRHAEALMWAQKAYDLDPTSVDVRHRQVEALCRLLRFTEAEDTARGFVAERPHRVSERMSLGKTLEAQRKYAEALTVFESAHALDQTDAEIAAAKAATLCAMRCHSEAAAILAAARARHPDDIGLRVEEAYVQLDRGNHAHADMIFSEVLGCSVSDAEKAIAQHGRGWTAMGARRYSEAIAHFTAAAGHAPGDADPLIGLAWANLRLGGSAELVLAEGHCRAVLAEHPSRHLAHSCLGMVAYQRQEYPVAERHFLKSIELAPFDGCHIDLGSLYLQLGRYEEAEGHLRKAVELDPWDADAHVRLGTFYLQRAEAFPTADTQAADVKSATIEFGQASAIDPDSDNAAIGLAIALARAPGNLAMAEDILRRALSRPAGDQPRWQLHLTLARLLIQAGDATQSTEMYEGAVQEAGSAIKSAATEPEPYFVAGIAEQRLGSQSTDLRMGNFYWRRAHKHFTKSLKLGGDASDARHAIRLLEAQRTAARASASRGGLLVVTSVVLLVGMWLDFVWKHHVTTLMLTTLTPVLVGLMAIGFLMPLLVRLKLPGGMEADLSVSQGLLATGPTGEFKISPRRFPENAKPTGQLPRSQRLER